MTNCIIGTLRLMDRTGSAHRPNLTLKNCWIGTLVLAEACVDVVKIEGGGIANWQVPSGEKKNPFVRSCEIAADVHLPTSTAETLLFQGPQSYRNLFAHLMKLDNVLVATRCRAIQLRTERNDEHGFQKIANWLYGTFSNYGASPGLPLWFLLAAYVIAVLLVYFCDHGGILGMEEGFYKGELKSFTDPCWGRLVRSLWLPFQSIINPLFILVSAQKLVIPNMGSVGVFLLLQGFFCDLLILFSAFSLRRRFKTD